MNVITHLVNTNAPTGIVGLNRKEGAAMSAQSNFWGRPMVLNLIGAGDESETTIRVKLWPVISLIIAALVGLAIYSSGHESRLCVVEKASITVEKKVDSINSKVEQMAKDQDLYFSLREPRWSEWKKWDAKQRKAEEK